jgi:hypothetical protein
MPILSCGAPVWIECLKRNNVATKHERVQTLININIATAFRAAVRSSERINRDDPSLNRTGKSGQVLSYHYKQEDTTRQKTTENGHIPPNKLR